MATESKTNSVSVIQLFVAKYSDNAANLDSSNSNFPQGSKDIINDLNLRNKIAGQTGVTSSVFNTNFVDYAGGRILCVNTSQALEKFEGDGLSHAGIKFTMVFMPEEFKGRVSELSSGYLYGEALTVSIVASQSRDGRPSYGYVYRDANRKGRSVLGGTTQSAGVGIGVWS
jgi:hypothetical protein